MYTGREGPVRLPLGPGKEREREEVREREGVRERERVLVRAYNSVHRERRARSTAPGAWERGREGESKGVRERDGEGGREWV